MTSIIEEDKIVVLQGQSRFQVLTLKFQKYN